MFRFNNPDALLVFLLTAAGYLTLRAAEKASGRLLVGAGVLIGFAFLTKMLQAFLVLPAFALVYLIAAPTTVRKRLLHLLAAFGATIVSLGWWVAIVELVPASWRPYVGGSENNSVLDLIFGYNGLGRIFGQGGGAGGGPGGMFGEPSVTRLFAGVSGGMIAWLIPAALLLGTLALVIIRRADRSHPVRAAIMLWGGWLLVTGLVFSFMAGTYHDYYTVALAPAIAGAGRGRRARLCGGSGAARLARVGLSGTMIITAVWAFVLLGRATAPYSALRWPVLIIGILAAAGLLVANRLPKALAGVVLGLALLSAGTGPGGVRGADRRDSASRLDRHRRPGERQLGSGRAGRIRTHPDGCRTGRSGDVPGRPDQAPQGGRSRVSRAAMAPVSAPSSRRLLRNDASSYRWAAATTGSQSAAGYQLATELPVMAIGGFTGSDAEPDARAVPGATWLRARSTTTSPAATGGGRGGGSSSASADRDLGQRELHRHHGRKRRSLRPHRRPLSRSNDRPGPKASSRHDHRDECTGT